MTHRPFHLVLLAFSLTGLVPATAQAQWYGAPRAQPAPLYPYELQPGQTYAVEVAPGAYVIHRPTAAHRYHYRGVRRHRRVAQWTPTPRPFSQPHRRNDATPIARLRRHGIKRTVIQTRRIVREKPVVIVHRRVVEDAPRRGLLTSDPVRRDAEGSVDDGARVIHADAVVTILGPDRINIRLYRKRGADAGAGGATGASVATS